MKKKKILDQELQFTSIKNVQVKEEAFSSQKRTSTSKHEIFKFFSTFVIFALRNPDPDPLTRLNTDPIGIRILIRNPGNFMF
jgi:hypothetical protein